MIQFSTINNFSLVTISLSSIFMPFILHEILTEELLCLDTISAIKKNSAKFLQYLITHEFVNNFDSFKDCGVVLKAIT